MRKLLTAITSRIGDRLRLDPELAPPGDDEVVAHLLTLREEDADSIHPAHFKLGSEAANWSRGVSDRCAADRA